MPLSSGKADSKPALEEAKTMKSSRSVSHGAPKLPTTLYPDMSAPHYEHYVDDAKTVLCTTCGSEKDPSTPVHLPLYDGHKVGDRVQRIWPDYGGAKDRGQIGTVTWVSEDKSHIKVTLSTGGLPPPGSARAARGAAASTPKGKEIVVLSAKFKPAGNVMTSQLAKGMSERFTKEHRVNEQPRPLPQRTEDSIIAHHVSERPRLTPSQSRTSVAPSSTTSSSRRAAASSSSSTTSSSTAASSGPAGGAAPPQSSRYEQVWVRALVSQNKVTTPGGHQVPQSVRVEQPFEMRPVTNRDSARDSARPSARDASAPAPARGPAPVPVQSTRPPRGGAGPAATRPW